MSRTEAASHWADTALGYFETMTPKQGQPPETSADPLPAPHRHKLPPLTASPSILVALAACSSSHKASVKPLPVTLAPLKVLMPA